MYYRKYRSQTIAEIDNAEIRGTLGKALLEDKFSHAYLLIGTRGSGKTSMARLIAKIVNCTRRKLGEEPCNECESCVAVTEGRALDVIEIDAASNTGVDDIRDLREKVKLAPVQGKYKVYIIDEVHMLSTSAFNALLKTLEEPPGHVIFVLATTDPQKLPETIVSRCLVYDFKTASGEELVRSILRVVEGEKIKVEDGVVEKIADLGRGSFRDALKILEQLAMRGGKISLEQLKEESSESTYEVAVEILFALCDKNSTKVLEVIEKFSKSGGTIETLIEEMLKVLQNNLLATKGVSKEKPIFSLSDKEISTLVPGLVTAGIAIRDCPVPQLPLEVMLANFMSTTSKDHEVKESPPVKEPVGVKVSEIKEEPAIEERKAEEVSIVRETYKAVGAEKPASKEERVVSAGVSAVGLSTEAVLSKWQEILTDLKPYNHSLVAFLRACRPKEVIGDTLIVDVFYKFHRDKLSEQRNREIFEDVVSKIFGVKVRAKFDLSEKKVE